MDRILDGIDFGNTDHIRALLDCKYKFDNQDFVSYEGMFNKEGNTSIDESAIIIFEYLSILIEESKLSDKQLVYLDMYTSGFTYEEIGKHYGVGKSTAKRNMDTIIKRITKNHSLIDDFKVQEKKI